MVKCTCGNSFRNLTELKIHRHLQWPLTESMEKHKPDMSDASTRKAVNNRAIKENIKWFFYKEQKNEPRNVLL